MIDLLKTRRSIRKYSKDKVKQVLIDELINAMLLAPSGKNSQPNEFVHVDDTELLVQLSESKAGGAQFLKDAPHCIVVLSDESKTDTWIEDGSIAFTIGHLQAHALGLGSCWIQIRNRKTKSDDDSEQYVRRLLNIPDHLRVIGLLSFGYPDEVKEAKIVNQTIDKVFHNTYK